MLLQRQHAQHGGITGGADGHGLLRRESIRQRHQPVALQARLLGQAAPVRFADTPAVEHHAVAGLVVRVVAGLDRTGNIDARHHREFAHHRALAGDRQAVLVVQRRTLDAHRHVALGQLRLVDVLHRSAVAGVVLLDQYSLEHPRLLGQFCRQGCSATAASRFSTSLSIANSTVPTTIMPPAR